MAPESTSLALSFLAGLAAFLSPCVLPLVPGVLAVNLGLGTVAAEGRTPSELRRRGASNAALLVIGFSLVFLGFGAAATVPGQWLRDVAPALQRFGGGAFAALGIVLAFGAVARPGRVAHRHPVGAATEGLLSMGAGTILAAAWTPCIGPVLATALLYAGAPETMGRGITLLGAYSLGLGVGVFACGAAPVWALSAGRRGRACPRALRGLAGLAMSAVGVLLLSGRLAALTAALAGFAPLIPIG